MRFVRHLVGEALHQIEQSSVTEKFSLTRAEIGAQRSRPGAARLGVVPRHGGRGSANGKRRAESPRRTCRRLSPLSEMSAQQRREFHEGRGHLRGSPGEVASGDPGGRAEPPGAAPRLQLGPGLTGPAQRLVLARERPETAHNSRVKGPLRGGAFSERHAAQLAPSAIARSRASRKSSSRYPERTIWGGLRVRDVETLARGRQR
jgi:hypothetical protein